MLTNIIEWLWEFKWLWRHQDDIVGASGDAWLLVSLVLLFRLRVFRSASLAKAPARTSGLSVVILAASILLYFAAAIMAVSVSTAVRQTADGEGATTMAAHTQAGTQAATRAATQAGAATATASGPATREVASTVPARAPATTSTRPAATQVAGQGPDPSVTLRESLVTTFAEMVPAIALILISFRMVEGGIDGWGLSLRKVPRGIGLGLLGFLAVFPILMFVANIDDMLIQKFRHRAEEVHVTLQALSRPIPGWEQAVFILLAGVAAPLLEEIFFRGLVQTMLIQPYCGFSLTPVMDHDYRPPVWRRWMAILITSVLFASMHAFDHFPVIFLLSVSLGYLYERTANMWANITLHALFNSFSMYLVLLGNGQ